MIRVLVVDDSLIIRKEFTKILSLDAGIDVVGTATDPYAAREKIVALKPDVMTLDIEMPRMDGLTFLGKVMRYCPLPVVVVSSLTTLGSSTAIQALEMGAVDVICKPESEEGLQTFSKEMIEKIKAAAMAHVQPLESISKPSPIPAVTLPHGLDQLLVLGASTGGPDALSRIFKALPKNTPGTLIVQHMPEYILPAFVARLNQIGEMQVAIAQGGEALRPGLAFIAPAERHMLVHKQNDHFVALVKDGPKVYHQKPSVEVLFHSAARQAGSRSVGVLLTGMGTDGAGGLLEMRKAGAVTMAQDEQSSVVFGMPKAAADLGAAEKIASLESIPNLILQAFQSMDVSR
jgi:two-component system chemotaxis response regulator CheB